MHARNTRSATATGDAGSRRAPSSPRAVSGADLDNDSHGGIPLAAESSIVDVGSKLILADPIRRVASDIVVSSPGGFGVLPFDPSAGKFESPNEYSAGAPPDFDGDRRLDAVTTNVVGSTIGFFVGHGRCGLPSGAPAVTSGILIDSR